MAAPVTDRDSIAAYLARTGHPELARAVEAHEDRRRPEPTVPASEWIRVPSVG